MTLSDLTPIHYGYELRREGQPTIQFIRHTQTDKYMATVNGKFISAGTLPFVMREVSECLPSSK